MQCFPLPCLGFHYPLITLGLLVHPLFHVYVPIVEELKYKKLIMNMDMKKGREPKRQE
jgi:hypothetical protein